MRVVIAEDSVLLREGLARLLGENGFRRWSTPVRPRTTVSSVIDGRYLDLEDA